MKIKLEGIIWMDELRRQLHPFQADLNCRALATTSYRLAEALIAVIAAKAPADYFP